MTRKTIAWIFFIGMLSACWSRDIQVNVTFDRLSGLTAADRVVFEDNTIGAVQAVAYNPDGTYTVQVRIEKSFESAVTQYSHFRIAGPQGRDGRS